MGKTAFHIVLPGLASHSIPAFHSQIDIAQATESERFRFLRRLSTVSHR